MGQTRRSILLFGKKVKLFVADAKYRARKMIDTADHNYGGPGYQTEFFINPGNRADDASLPLAYECTDELLNSKFGVFDNDGTAYDNTDRMVKFETTQAAHWVRSLNIGGLGSLSIPNARELATIYAEADNLDAIDPTVDAYADYGLGFSTGRGRFWGQSAGGYWTSSDFRSDLGMMLSISSSGFVSPSEVKVNFAVVPVKELSIG